MEKICTNCNHIGLEVRTVYYHVIAPVFLLIIGVLSYRYLASVSYVAAITSFVWVIFGIFTLIKFMDIKNECPNCRQKRTMIPLDTPKAQALIKEHNLSIPEDALQGSGIKEPSQTNQ